MRRLLLLTLGCALAACSDDAGPGPDAATDAATDGGAPDPVTFEAEPDPSEREACLGEPPSGGVARAKHVQCEDELLGGSVAMGRVGDIVIESSRARFILRSGETAASILGAYAGGVVDAAPHGKPDLLKEVFPALDLSGMRPTDLVVTDAGGDGGASVRMLFEGAPLGLVASVVGGTLGTVKARGAVDYTLHADEAALRITITVTTRRGERTAGGRPSFVALVGGAAQTIQPGEGVLDGDASGGSAGARLVGDAPPAGFALRMVPHDPGSVSRIDSIHMVSAEDRVLFREGETVTFEARLGVGNTAAGAWNEAHRGEDALAPLRIVGPAGDRVAIRTPDGTPVLRTHLDGDGEATVRLASGDYVLRTGFRRFFPGDPVDTSLGADGTRVDLPAPPSGTLHVTASAGGVADAPVRVTLERDGKDVGRHVVMGSRDIRLPPGDYHVTVSRGMEHTMHAADVTIEDGRRAEVDASLTRVVDTDGWVAGDFHLHSEMSPDSSHALAHAVRMIAAEGIEVVAATDHDFLTDYGPALEDAGIAEWVVAVTGDELSHPSIAHVGAYPLAREPGKAAMGAPAWFDTTPGQWFDALRAKGKESLGGAIVQINHPRRDGAGFFESIGLDRDTGMATVSPEELGLPGDTDLNDFDFDVIEVWNDGRASSDEKAFRDFLALYAMGRTFGMVGNSDSHEPGNPPGSPRTFLRVADDSRGAFGWEEVASSMRAGEMTVGNGVFVTAEPMGPPSGGMLPLHVRVQAPPRVGVERLRIYAGTEVAVEQSIPDTAAVTRFDETVEVPLSGASFVVARADGSSAPEPLFDEAPFGITNPVEVP